MRTAIELLEAAKARIANPANWTKFYLILSPEAETPDIASYAKLPVEVQKACRFCMGGALIAETVDSDRNIRWHTFRHLQYKEYLEALNFLLDVVPLGSVPRTNDAEATTHADVLEYYTQAIARAKAAENGGRKMEEGK